MEGGIGEWDECSAEYAERPPLAARQQSCSRRSLEQAAVEIWFSGFGATTTAVSSASLTSAFMHFRKI
jgi:hypothetical protein